MPEICGYQTIEKIRQRKAWSGVPIIARTAKAMKGDSEKCFEAGASDDLAKPAP
jgi:CheY-like chemotaxis protein